MSAIAVAEREPPEAGPSAKPRPRTLKLSASRVSKRFSGRLRRAHPNLELWSLTLTERSGVRAEVERRGRLYAAKILSTYPNAGIILALDRGAKRGHWHLHGVVLLPLPRHQRELTEEGRRDHLATRAVELRRIWLRLWPKKKGSDRPYVGAQKLRPIGGVSGSRRALTKKLKHALDRHSEIEARQRGDTRFRMSNVLTRIVIEGDWVRALLDDAMFGKPKLTKPRWARRKTAARGERCAWCGERFEELVRRDARRHPECARRARHALDTVVRRAQPRLRRWLGILTERAFRFGVPVRPDFDLDAFVKHDPIDVGWHVRTWVAALQEKGWRDPDALRVVEEAIRIGDWPTLHPLSNPKLAGALRCLCGKPKADRIDATTCGASRCRVARHRSGQRIAARKGRSSTQGNLDQTIRLAVDVAAGHDAGRATG